MNLSTTERAQIVVRYLAKKEGVTQYEIGQKLGYKNKGSLSGIINGHRTFPGDLCERLAALDPEINPDFLSGKSDEMLRPEYAQPTVPEIFAKQQERPSGVYLPLELVKMFTDLSETIRSQQETIRFLVGKGDLGAKVI